MSNKLSVLLAIIFIVSCKFKILPPTAVMPVPTERQMLWHEMEFFAFVHFNMNTFTDMEWGFGDENPALFNPSELDCNQWAETCKKAGMKGIILTAKHHDGFCLWPSEFTEHSVKNSPWKNGKGDVVKELADACKKHGLKLGIYLSPWDRNHADYGNEKYLQYFRNQLRELMSNYGEIYEVWFDGANGGTGYYGGANEERRIDRKNYYDWENTRKIVRELQPLACMFSDAGPDIRWVGNEEGWAMETNWALIRRDEFYPGSPNYKDLRTGHEDGTHWVPAEVDVSIRPGWYYHSSEDHKVKTLPHLLDIYYNSIGRNASLLINFPVDTRGLIHEKDAEQIFKLADAVKADFEHNLAENVKIKASNVRGKSKQYSAKNVVDNNQESYWATDDSVQQATLTLDFEQEIEFNRFLIQEKIQLGQRVKYFSVEVLTNNNWVEIARQTTIGRKRILRFPNVKASKLRLHILDAKACPVISNIEIYKAPKVLIEPEISRNKEGFVSMKAFDVDLDIFYTIDGTEPTETSTMYKDPFLLNNKSIFKAVAIDFTENKKSPVTTGIFDVSKADWKTIGEFENTEITTNIFDGNPETAWTLETLNTADIIVDLGKEYHIKGVKYLPDQGRWNPGIIFDFEFYVNEKNANWGNPLLKGEFSNIKNSPVWQVKEFAPQKGRFIKFKALSSALESGKIGLAELDIITE